MSQLHAAFDFSIKEITKELGFKLSEKDLSELKPHLISIETIEQLTIALGNINLTTVKLPHKHSVLDMRLAPFLIYNSESLYLCKKNGSVINCKTQEKVNPNNLPKQYSIYCFKKPSKGIDKPNKLIDRIIQKYKKNYWQCLAISFFINLFALATPLFIISIYNQVIGTYSPWLLMDYIIGIIILISAYAGLYLLRSYILVQVSSYIDRTLAKQTLKHIYNLPSQLIESSSISNQMSRLQDFNMVRNFLSSTALITCFDLPFTIIFIVVIAVLGGWLAVFPIVTCLFFSACFWIQWKSKAPSSEDNITSSLQQTQFELLNFLPNVKHSNLTKLFLNKYKENLADKITRGSNHSIRTAKINHFSDAIILISAFLLLSFGALQAINNHLSAGALIAMVILNWRALGPFKGIYACTDLFKHVYISYKELSNLFEIPPEKMHKPLTKTPNITKHIKGNIRFDHVSFRYPGSNDIALNDINFSSEPGEIIAISGDSASGKTTLLKLILGLATPNFGNIFIEENRLSQYPIKQLRESIAYVPQKFSFIYGTIAQNIRLSDPNATDEKLWQSCSIAGITEEIKKLPDQLNTRIHDRGLHQFNNNLLQGISLARAWLKQSQLILLDDPVSHLDDYQVACFTEHLLKIRNHATIIMNIHRPSIIRLADKVLFLSDGRLEHTGKPNDVLPKII